MFIILAGIVLGVSAFYGLGYDFREAEARVLADSVVDCFDVLGVEKVFDEDFNIYRECGFHANVEEEHLIYVKRTSDGNEFFIGVLDYKNQCFLKGAEKNKNFPKCKSWTITRDNGGFEIIVGSNQRSRRLVS